jgi:hypothetical protein
MLSAAETFASHAQIFCTTVARTQTTTQVQEFILRTLLTTLFTDFHYDL